MKKKLILKWQPLFEAFSISGFNSRSVWVAVSIVSCGVWVAVSIVSGGVWVAVSIVRGGVWVAEIIMVVVFLLR